MTTSSINMPTMLSKRSMSKRPWNCQFRLYRRLPHQKMGYKIFPGFKWYHQKYSSYVVWRLATSRDVAGFRSIRSREVFSDKQTNRESTYCKNKDNITINIDISQYQSLVYQVSKAKNTVRKSILLHWLQTWTQFFLVLNAYTGECSSITSPYFGGKGDPNQNACTADTFCLSLKIFNLDASRFSIFN